MQKISIPSAGGYDKLTIKTVNDPSPGPQDVLIDVSAIGINYADICVRLGVYESAKQYVGWPITPGFEVSGTVIQVGNQVKDYQEGDQVIGFTLFNGYATKVSVPESQVLPIPKGFTMEQAAGFPAVFFTAYHALFQQGYIPPKSNILIHSAAGGVGTALTQLCKMAGHKTVGVIGSSHKKSYLEQFEPDHIIDKSQEDLWEKAEEYAPEGYHAIFDANGASTMKESYQHLKPTGKLIVYGAHSLLSKSGGKLNYLKAGIGLLKTPKFNPMEMISNNKGVLGFNLSFLFSEKEMIATCTQKLLQYVESGKIKPIPVTTFSFNEVAKAHQHIESGQSVGKLILKV